MLFLHSNIWKISALNNQQLVICHKTKPNEINQQWIISIPSLISTSFSYFTKNLGTVLRLPMTIGVNVTLIPVQQRSMFSELVLPSI